MDVSETPQKPKFPGRVGDGTPGPGRPKGSLDKRAQSGVEFAKAALARHPGLVDQFLSSEDERIRFDCWKLLVEYECGKPVQRLEVDLEAEARKYADRAGFSVEEVLAKSEALVASALN